MSNKNRSLCEFLSELGDEDGCIGRENLLRMIGLDGYFYALDHGFIELYGTNLHNELVYQVVSR